MVRRGSTVRVRQRALQKRCKSARFRSGRFCTAPNVRQVWSRLWSSHVQNTPVPATLTTDFRLRRAVVAPARYRANNRDHLTKEALRGTARRQERQRADGRSGPNAIGCSGKTGSPRRAASLTHGRGCNPDRMTEAAGETTTDTELGRKAAEYLLIAGRRWTASPSSPRRNSRRPR